MRLCEEEGRGREKCIYPEGVTQAHKQQREREENNVDTQAIHESRESVVALWFDAVWHVRVLPGGVCLRSAVRRRRQNNAIVACVRRVPPRCNRICSPPRLERAAERGETKREGDESAVGSSRMQGSFANGSRQQQ